MATRVRIEMNKDGFQELLKSEPIRADLDRRARAIAAAAGDGMLARSSIGTTRARAQVITDSLDAKLAEAKDKSLTKAIDAGRS